MRNLKQAISMLAWSDWFLGSMDLAKGFGLIHSPSCKDHVPKIIGLSFFDLDDHAKLRVNMCSKDMLERL
jgi:hypothetical protein